MVYLTLTNVDMAQKNKRNHDTMTLLDSDDERGDKEYRYEHEDEGSLYAESTGDATEAASEQRTGNKTKKTTAAATAAVAKPRKKDQKPVDLNRLGDSSRRVRHDAGRPSFYSSARCVIFGPTLLRGISCVGVVVNHAR
jgi:hypothetical protein